MSNDETKARARESLAISNIMANEGGRSFMWRCLEVSGVFADNFDPDPYQHAANAGRRSHGIWLQSELLAVAPGSYAMMIKENNDVDSRDSDSDE